MSACGESASAGAGRCVSVSLSVGAISLSVGTCMNEVLKARQKAKAKGCYTTKVKVLQHPDPLTKLRYFDSQRLVSGRPRILHNSDALDVFSKT